MYSYNSQTSHAIWPTSFSLVLSRHLPVPTTLDRQSPLPADAKWLLHTRSKLANLTESSWWERRSRESWVLRLANTKFITTTVITSKKDPSLDNESILLLIVGCNRRLRTENWLVSKIATLKAGCYLIHSGRTETWTSREEGITKQYGLMPHYSLSNQIKTCLWLFQTIWTHRSIKSGCQRNTLPNTGPLILVIPRDRQFPAPLEQQNNRSKPHPERQTPEMPIRNTNLEREYIIYRTACSVGNGKNRQYTIRL